MGIAFGSSVERAGVVHRPKGDPTQGGSPQEGQFGLVVFTSICPDVTS